MCTSQSLCWIQQPRRRRMGITSTSGDLLARFLDNSLCLWHLACSPVSRCRRASEATQPSSRHLSREPRIKSRHCIHPCAREDVSPHAGTQRLVCARVPSRAHGVVSGVPGDHGSPGQFVARAFHEHCGAALVCQVPAPPPSLVHSAARGARPLLGTPEISDPRDAAARSSAYAVGGPHTTRWLA